MFKCIHDLAPNYMCDGVTPEHEIANHSNRSTDTLNVHIPMSSDANVRKTFMFHAAELWNKLPESLKGVNNIHNFKGLIKMYLLEL